MSVHCCPTPPPASPAADPRYRRVLWVALWVNVIMFAVEIFGGVLSGSVSLLADAIDFAGDAANYGLSLAVLGMGIVARARTALVKGLSMGAFGIFVLGKAAWTVQTGAVPEPLSMGLIALLALCANVGVTVMLFKWREGDANMRSVWLCSRNDAISNVAVAIAAVGVFGTGSAWPDLVVAAIMASLALFAAVSVVRQARGELATAAHEH